MSATRLPHWLGAWPRGPRTPVGGPGWPWRGASGRVVRAALGAVGLLGLASGVQVVTVTGFPPLRTLGPLVAALLVGALPVAVPLAVLHGVAGELRAARRDGRWEALAAMGRSPDRTLGALVVGAGVVAGVLVVGEHVAFPRARAALAGLRAEAALTLAPGAHLQLGDWTVTRDAGDGAAIGGSVHAVSGSADGAVVVNAQSLDVVAEGGGTSARLGPGALRRGEGAAAVEVRFAALTSVVPGTGPRLPVDARPTGTFTPRGPYEAWILLKRTLVPLLLVPLVVTAAALGVRGRLPGAWLVGGVVVSAWGLVRALDGLVRAERVGLGVAAAILLGSAGLAAWVGRRALT